MARSRDQIRAEIHRLVGEYFSADGAAMPSGRLPLAVPTYGAEEVNDSIDVLLSTFVTMGERVRAFEKQFAQKVGAAEAVMVNSGSSANLLALAVLANPLLAKPLLPGDEVIVPAVTWPTTLWPVIQMGGVPVLVDVSLDTLCMDIRQIQEAIGPKTRGIMPVHLLGNACDMDAIMGLARRHNLFVVEDTCEALGTRYDGKMAGTFGDFGTYSFFFSHHMTTMEGGMVVTDDPQKAELARILRAHGWIRDAQGKKDLAAKHPHLDPRFLFVNIGYNLRPMEIQAAFGKHQIGKLDGFNRVRVRNAEAWAKRLEKYSRWIHVTRPEAKCAHTWFAYPLLVKEGAPFSKREIIEHLEADGIETRPVVAGNLAAQPALAHFPHRISGKLERAQAVMERGFFFGNHGVLTEDQCRRVGDALEAFLSRYK